MRTVLVVAAAAFSFAACATAPRGRDAAPALHVEGAGGRATPAAFAERAARATRGRAALDVIPPGEFAEAHGAGSVLAALDVLRPGAVRRMAARGGTPAVVINGAYAGPLEVLATLSAQDVASVRLVRAAEATFAYPQSFGRTGVIVVTLVPAPSRAR